jgi:hypothetical protein
MRSLNQEAVSCRRTARRFAGRPEAPFLLKLASAFEELALITGAGEPRNSQIRH